MYKKLHLIPEEASTASPVSNCRRCTGMGLLGCIEGRPDQYGYTLVEERKLGALLDKACEEMGLLVRPLINMAVFSPPLVINTSQIDDMFDILDKALKKVSQI